MTLPGTNNILRFIRMHQSSWRSIGLPWSLRVLQCRGNHSASLIFHPLNTIRFPYTPLVHLYLSACLAAGFSVSLRTCFPGSPRVCQHEAHIFSSEPLIAPYGSRKVYGTCQAMRTTTNTIKQCRTQYVLDRRQPDNTSYCRLCCLTLSAQSSAHCSRCNSKWAAQCIAPTCIHSTLFLRNWLTYRLNA